MFTTWLPWRIARLTVSPLRSASSSKTGRATRARSSSETTEPAKRTRPYPRRYFSVLGFCSTRPCAWSVDSRRKTVDLCTSSRRARSVTRISGSVPRSFRISSARSSDCTLLRVTKPVLMAQQLYRRFLGLASPSSRTSARLARLDPSDLGVDRREHFLDVADHRIVGLGHDR